VARRLGPDGFTSDSRFLRCSSTTARAWNSRNFIHRPGSDLYIVYNDQSQTGLPAGVFGRKDRQLVVKVTYLLQR
jgi:hypothetical protein